MDIMMEYTAEANTQNNSLITNTTTVEREKFIYIGTAFIIISISGILGNVLVIFAVAASTKLQTATNVFVANLSIADLFTCLVIPFNSLIMFSSFETPIPEWFCGIVAGVTFTSASCSIFTLTMIAINRFLLIKRYKIYHSIFSHLGIVVSITFTWVAAFSATTLPPLLGVGQLGINQKYRLCGGVSSDEGVDNQEIIQTVTCFPLPTSIIIFCYTSIYFHIRRHYKKMTRSLSVVNSFPDNTDNSISRSSVDAGPQPGSKFRRKSSSGTMARSNHSSAALTEDSGQRRVSKSRLASISGTLKRSNKRRRDQLSISKNLFYTTIAFSACVTPYSLFLVIPDLTGMELPILLLHCSGVLLLMSSAINPLLYGFKHPHFKEVFLMLLTGRWSRVPNSSNSFKTILETCGSRGNAAYK